MRFSAIVLGLAAVLAAPSLFAQEAPERIERGNLVIEGVPDIPTSLIDRINQFQNARIAAFSDWAPGGNGILISTRFGETSQVHHVATPMGMRRQITFFPEPIAGAGSRNGHDSQIIFSKDVGGNERYQLYLYDLATGVQTQLTDPELRNIEPVQTDDGSGLIWMAPRDNEGNYNIWMADFDDPENRRIVHEADGFWYPIDISPDNGTAIIIHYVSSLEGEIALLNLAEGEVMLINPVDQVISYDNAAFAADGSAIYFTSDENDEFFDLVRFNIASGEMAVLTADIPWNVESFDISPDGEHAVISVNAGGLSEVRVISLADGTTVATPDVPVAVISGLTYDATGANIGFTVDAATAPDNAWSYEVATGALTQWTDSEVGGLDTATFVEPELISYTSFDGLEVPAFIYRPEGDGPHPVMIYAHGGPESQFRPRFSSNFQYWASEMGIAIIAPNVRGSSGYGKTYVGLDNGFAREDSVRDIGALLDWIDDQSELDSDRVVIYGGSYGGYMVLASMVHYNDRLAAGIDVVGISNFVTFLENTQGYRRNLRRTEYGDERDPEMRAHLEAISPLTNASAISRPLFIIQGLNDPRVPAGEADQMLAAVRANGGEAWYLLATDEGHGFRKKSNRDFQYQAIALFLEQVLFGAE